MANASFLAQLTALCLSATLLTGCAFSALHDEFDSIAQYYQSHDKPESQWNILDRVKLHSVEAGTATKPVVVFIHGTPGNRSFFANYIHHPQLQDHARLIAIDRPGWGDSAIIGEFEPTLSEQSKMLGKWLCETAKLAPDGKLILVGHSYGATLSPRLALDNPDCISGMILLSGAGDPNLAAPRWYNKLAQYQAIGWLADWASGGLSQSNTEMMPIQAELEKIRHRWNEIKQPVIVFQGGEDPLVDPGHADFFEKKLNHLPAKVIRMADEGHFILFSHRQMVVDEILTLVGAEHSSENSSGTRSDTSSATKSATK